MPGHSLGLHFKPLGFRFVQSWGTGIRTPILASKGRCPTVRRSPSFEQNVCEHFIDGQEIITTGFLRWSLGWTGGEPSQFATLPLSTGILDLSPATTPGQHVLGLQAEGQVSGCNTSGVGGWIGTLYIYT